MMPKYYISDKTGKPYYGAPVEQHFRKIMGYKSVEDFVNSAYDAGYDAGYEKGKKEEREKWKEAHLQIQYIFCPTIKSQP